MEVLPIEEVEPDINSMSVGTVKNPSKKQIDVQYDGKYLYEFKPGEEKTMTLPIAVHCAKHIAARIIAEEHDASIEKIKDEKEREMAKKNPIPNFKQRRWVLMQKIVETDDDFMKTEFGTAEEVKAKRLEKR